MINLIKKKLKYTKQEPTVYSFYYIAKNLSRLSLSKVPIRCRDQSISCNPFFIIGSGRSGNTLLRAILTSNEDIAIPPESYVLGSVARTFSQINNLSWPEVFKKTVSLFKNYPKFYDWETDLNNAETRMSNLTHNNRGLDKIIDLIYSSYIQQNKPKAKRWGDKTPLNVFHLWWINQIFPKAQFIHIIRDGRDVVNSYLKSGIYKSPEKSAERWKQSVELAQNFGKKIGNTRYIEVRYENLVMTPEKEIKKLCDFLKINFKKSMLKPENEYIKLVDAKQAKHHSNLKKPINIRSIGKWKKELSTSDQKTVSKLLNDKLIKLGYE